MEAAGFVVAVLALVISAFAALYAIRMKRSADAAAGRAIGLAEASNTIATDAKGLAEEANEISKRTETREVERHDVSWAYDHVSPGRFRIRKLGDDPAYSVRFEFEFEDQLVRGHADLVEADGDGIELEVQAAKDEFARLYRDRQTEIQQQQSHAQLGLSLGSSMSVVYMAFHSRRLRVYWSTATGTPRVFDEEERNAGVFAEFLP